MGMWREGETDDMEGAVSLHVRTCDVPAGSGPAHHAGWVSNGNYWAAVRGVIHMQFRFAKNCLNVFFLQLRQACLVGGSWL